MGRLSQSMRHPKHKLYLNSVIHADLSLLSLMMIVKVRTMPTGKGNPRTKLKLHSVCTSILLYYGIIFSILFHFSLLFITNIFFALFQHDA